MAAKHKIESGNIIFFILLAIVLVGLVTAALRSSGIEGANIDSEALVIKVAQLRQNATELERATALVMQNGISESDISFANPDDGTNDYGIYDTNPKAEIFNPKGGGALWRTPPAEVNDGSPWAFYGSTKIPGIGTARPDLIAVLPKVTRAFCEAINKINEQPTAPPPDSGSICLYGGTVFIPNGFTDNSANTMTETSFRQGSNGIATPAQQACVTCSDGTYHFYHVLLGR